MPTPCYDVTSLFSKAQETDNPEVTCSPTSPVSKIAYLVNGPPSVSRLVHRPPPVYKRGPLWTRRPQQTDTALLDSSKWPLPSISTTSLHFRSTLEESLLNALKPNPSRRHRLSLSAAPVSTRPSHPFHRLPRPALPNLEHKSPPSSPSAFLDKRRNLLRDPLPLTPTPLDAPRLQRETLTCFLLLPTSSRT